MLTIRRRRFNRSGFTLVELLIVIVVIAVLAAITVVAYNGIAKRAAASVLQSDLRQAAMQLGETRVDTGSYPLTIDVANGTYVLKRSPGTIFEYLSDGTTFHLTANSDSAQTSFHIDSTDGTTILAGADTAAGQVGYTGSGTTNATVLVSAGDSYTCAIAPTSHVSCWGLNNYGQLGNGTTTNSSTPVAINSTGVLAGKTVTALAAGEKHTCAIASGQAYCWGKNTYGMLGNGTTTDSSTPVAVDTSGVLAGKTVTAISTGDAGTCAIAAGQAYCWGENAYGDLGNNSTVESHVPVAVYTGGALSGKTVTSIATGNASTCLIASGQAYCFGAGDSGRLGNGTLNNYSVPTAVDASGVLSGKTLTSISTNIIGMHYCALAGQVYCWGYNTYGQIGNGTSSNSYTSPVAVITSGALSGKTVTALASSFGQQHTCVIASGQIYCWGDGSSGRLGNNSTTGSTTPVAVVDGSGVFTGKTITSMDLGVSHSCAVADSNIYCWGLNTYGQLGNGTTSNALVPTAISALQ